MSFWQCPSCFQIYERLTEKAVRANMRKHKKFLKITHKEMRSFYEGPYTKIDQFKTCVFCGTEAKCFTENVQFAMNTPIFIYPIFF